MTIDHVTIATPMLPVTQARFAEAGLPTEYGGPHSNGITHMSLAGFADGSYLELVSTLKGGPVPLWEGHLFPAEGGCAWTISVNDVAEELSRAARYGIPGGGPLEVRRRKPDGSEGRWELGYLGNAQPGGLLPFLIHDFTPRQVRVVPSPALSSVIQGWCEIVLAVSAFGPAIETFRRVYDWPQPEIDQQIARFKGTPVCLKVSAPHVASCGESPYAAVLDCSDPERALKMFRFSHSEKWMGAQVHWLDLGLPHFQIGLRLSSS